MRNVNIDNKDWFCVGAWGFILTMRNVNKFKLWIMTNKKPSFILTMRNVNQSKSGCSTTLSLVLY